MAVVETTVEDYKYDTKYSIMKEVAGKLKNRVVVLASNSLSGLKREVKYRGWQWVIIDRNDNDYFLNYGRSGQQFLDKQKTYAPRY